MRLPERWRVSELPEERARETDFGRLSLRVSSEDSRLELVREFVVEAVEVPLASYDVARGFFDEAMQVLTTPVVLERADR